MTNIANLTFKEFIVSFIIGNIIQPVTVLVFALAILFFLWNITQFIKKNDAPKELEKFKENAIWGIVALFVMASMWGLVQFLINSFVPGAGIPTFGSGGTPLPASAPSLMQDPSFNYSNYGLTGISPMKDRSGVINQMNTPSVSYPATWDSNLQNTTLKTTPPPGPVTPDATPVNGLQGVVPASYGNTSPQQTTTTP